MPTIWTQKFSQPSTDQTLPLALAMLLSSNSETARQNQLARLKSELPFVTSIWFGETSEKITNFAAARNLVLNQISEPWLFWLDSDEILADPDKSFIVLKNLLQKTDLSGLTLSREDWLHQKPLKYGETNAIKLLRIHRPQAGNFVNQVHEKFSLTEKAPPHSSPIKIFHHSHNSVGEFFNKISNYAQIRAKERFFQPNPPTKNRLFWELVCWPIGKFFYIFLWQQGWRDGFRGLIYATMMTLHSAFVRIFGLELLTTQPKQDHET